MRSVEREEIRIARAGPLERRASRLGLLHRKARRREQPAEVIDDGDAGRRRLGLGQALVLVADAEAPTFGRETR